MKNAKLIINALVGQEFFVEVMFDFGHIRSNVYEWQKLFWEITPSQT